MSGIRGVVDMRRVTVEAVMKWLQGLLQAWEGEGWKPCSGNIHFSFSSLSGVYLYTYSVHHIRLPSTPHPKANLITYCVWMVNTLPGTPAEKLNQDTLFAAALADFL